MATFLLYEDTFENKLMMHYLSRFSTLSPEDMRVIESLRDVSVDDLIQQSVDKHVVILLQHYFPSQELESIMTDKVNHPVELIIKDTDVIDKNQITSAFTCLSWYHYYSQLLQCDELDKNVLKSLTTNDKELAVRHVRRYCNSLMPLNGDAFKKEVQALTTTLAYQRGLHQYNAMPRKDHKAAYRRIQSDMFSIVPDQDIETAYTLMRDVNHVGALLCDISFGNTTVDVQCVVHQGSLSLMDKLVEGGIKIRKYSTNVIFFTMEWSSLVALTKSKELCWKHIKTL